MRYFVYLHGSPISKKFWGEIEGGSPKKLESLIIEVPNVVHVKVHVLSFNMNLISSP